MSQLLYQKLPYVNLHLIDRVVLSNDLFFSAVARYGQSKLSRFWYFARVELRPPMPSEFGEVQKGVQQIVKSASTGAWR